MIRIEHVLGENNVCMDWLADEAIQLARGIHRITDCPTRLKPLVFVDFSGIVVPGHVLCNFLFFLGHSAPFISPKK